MIILKEAMPIRRDTKMKQGADWHWTIKLKEADGVTAKNTAGYSMTMTIKSAPNGEVYDILTIASGKIVHTSASGQFNLNLTAAQIALYDFSSAYFDIIIVDAGNGNTCPFYGNIILIG